MYAHMVVFKALSPSFDNGSVRPYSRKPSALNPLHIIGHVFFKRASFQRPEWRLNAGSSTVMRY